MLCCAAAAVADDLHRGDEHSGAATDPGERGSLDVRDRVVQRMAVHAALATPGVQKYSAGLGKLTGRELPRARVDVSGAHVRAHLTIAVSWPLPLAEVAAAVQRNVARTLGDSAGLQVDGVDVVIESHHHRQRRPRQDSVMTMAPDRTGSPTDTDGLRTPPPGRAPVAAPAAGYAGTVIALLLLGLGVIALRDSAVSAGWMDGQLFLPSAIGWIDGLGFD